MTLIFNGGGTSSGGGGSSAITYKYPEMAMYLVDKDKYDAIVWSNSSESEIAKYLREFAESVLVGINECELVFADNFADFVRGGDKSSYVDILKNGSRITKVYMEYTSEDSPNVTFTELDGILKDKNIKAVCLGDGTASGDTNVKGLGIIDERTSFIMALVFIHTRNNNNE